MAILSVEPGWDRKYTTPTNSPQQVQKELHAEDTPHSGPQWSAASSETRPRGEKYKWTREEYIGIMEAYYTTKLLPSKNNTAQIWCNKNQDSKPDIDTNNLAN